MYCTELCSSILREEQRVCQKNCYLYNSRSRVPVPIQCLETTGISTVQYSALFNAVDYNVPVPRRTDYSSAALVIPICQATRQHYPVYTPFIIVWDRTPSSTVSNLNTNRQFSLLEGAQPHILSIPRQTLYLISKKRLNCQWSLSWCTAPYPRWRGYDGKSAFDSPQVQVVI